MIYALEFLGLLAVALSLAASPLLVDLVERFFSAHEALHSSGKAYQGYATAGLNREASIDRAEMRDEIRRVTNLLESGRFDPSHSPAKAGASPRVLRMEPRYRPSV